MVSAMLMVLFLGLLQVCLWAYARTMVTSAAAEVARHSALAGSTDAAVTDRMRTVLGDGLGTGTKSTLTCTSGGTAILAEVHCTMDAPGLVGILDGVMPQVDITAHAAREVTR
jgi:TadE-like protein